MINLLVDTMWLHKKGLRGCQKLLDILDNGRFKILKSILMILVLLMVVVFSMVMFSLILVEVIIVCILGGLQGQMPEIEDCKRYDKVFNDESDSSDEEECEDEEDEEDKQAALDEVADYLEKHLD